MNREEGNAKMIHATAKKRYNGNEWSIDKDLKLKKKREQTEKRGAWLVIDKYREEGYWTGNATQKRMGGTSIRMNNAEETTRETNTLEIERIETKIVRGENTRILAKRRHAWFPSETRVTVGDVSMQSERMGPVVPSDDRRNRKAEETYAGKKIKKSREQSGCNRNAKE
jgi:hypothetical protein